MRFTIRDVLALTFFVALFAGANSAMAHWQTTSGILLMFLGEIISGLGIVALFVVALERKAPDDERRRNSQN